MKVLQTNSDVGSIKIYSSSMAIFLNNGIGDLPSKVVISETKGKSIKAMRDETIEVLKELASVDANIIESRWFSVKTKAYLSDYDCGENPIYTFKRGRYQSVLYENATFLIQYIDDEV